MEEINQQLEKLLNLVSIEQKDIIRKEVLWIMEIARNKAFMDGYKYAIEVLKEGIIKEEKTK